MLKSKLCPYLRTSSILFPRISYGLPACKVCPTVIPPITDVVVEVADRSATVTFSFDYKMTGTDYFLFTITNTSTNTSINVQYAPAGEYQIGNLVNFNPYTLTITPFINGLQGTGYMSDIFAPPTNLNIWKNAESGAYDRFGNSVTFGNGMWVACGENLSGGDVLKYSYDGINWNNAASGDDFIEASGVAYGNGTFLAFGGGGTSTIKYSTDGMNWYDSTGAFSVEGLYGAYGNGVWIAVGNDPMNSIKRSLDNGVTWLNDVILGGSFPGYGYGVAYNGTDKWVAMGLDGVGVKTIKYSSDDGLNWLYASSGKYDVVGRKVAFADGIWIAVGNGAIRYSNDGINWQNSKNSGVTNGITVAYGNGWWLVGSSDVGNTMKISQNGLLWYSPLINLFTKICIGVAFDGVKRWVAVGWDSTSSIKYTDVL
jgi:hypothetical protein